LIKYLDRAVAILAIFVVVSDITLLSNILTQAAIITTVLKDNIFSHATPESAFG